MTRLRVIFTTVAALFSLFQLLSAYEQHDGAPVCIIAACTACFIVVTCR